MHVKLSLMGFAFLDIGHMKHSLVIFRSQHISLGMLCHVMQCDSTGMQARN